MPRSAPFLMHGENSYCQQHWLVCWDEIQGNYIQAKDEHNNYGFMIGGHGMADAMCAPQYGFVYLDTTSDRIRLFYFEIGDLDTPTLWVFHSPFCLSKCVFVCCQSTMIKG